MEFFNHIFINWLLIFLTVSIWRYQLNSIKITPRIMKCFICMITLGDSKIMSKHFKLVHALNENDTYRCTFDNECDQYVCSFGSLDRHFKNHNRTTVVRG